MIQISAMRQSIPATMVMPIEYKFGGRTVVCKPYRNSIKPVNQQKVNFFVQSPYHGEAPSDYFLIKAKIKLGHLHNINGYEQIAHLLEHCIGNNLAFKCEDFCKSNTNGFLYSENAYVNKDTTNYLLASNLNSIDYAIEHLVDSLKTLIINDSTFKEYNVICNEIATFHSKRFSQENRVFGHKTDNLQNTLIDFFKKFYTNNNISFDIILPNCYTNTPQIISETMRQIESKVMNKLLQEPRCLEIHKGSQKIVRLNENDSLVLKGTLSQTEDLKAISEAKSDLIISCINNSLMDSYRFKGGQGYFITLKYDDEGSIISFGCNTKNRETASKYFTEGLKDILLFPEKELIKNINYIKKIFLYYVRQNFDKENINVIKNEIDTLSVDEFKNTVINLFKDMPEDLDIEYANPNTLGYGSDSRHILLDNFINKTEELVKFIRNYINTKEDNHHIITNKIDTNASHKILMPEVIYPKFIGFIEIDRDRGSSCIQTQNPHKKAPELDMEQESRLDTPSPQNFNKNSKKTSKAAKKNFTEKRKSAFSLYVPQL